MGQLRLPERACCLEASLLACDDLADKVLTSLDTAFAEAATYPQHEAREQIASRKGATNHPAEREEGEVMTDLIVFAALAYLLACVFHLPLLHGQPRRWCFMCRAMEMNNGEPNERKR
jgi:hypothetical protein